jgi:hypothetical protein
VRVHQDFTALPRRREFQSFVDLGKREFMCGHNVPHLLDFRVAKHPDDSRPVFVSGVDGSCDGDVLFGHMSIRVDAQTTVRVVEVLLDVEEAVVRDEAQGRVEMLLIAGEVGDLVRSFAYWLSGLYFNSSRRFISVVSK